MAPVTPYADWSPNRTSTLISSSFCKQLLPPNFSDGVLSLADLIDIALQNNPNTKRTWAQARSAAASYGQNLSDYYPELDFSASYTRIRQSFFNTIVFVPFYQTTVNPKLALTYTLLDFGKRSSSADSAREALYVADYTHNQEIQTVLQTVMNDYYTYLYQKHTLEALYADLENNKGTLDAANLKFATGLAALGDVAQARTDYLQTKIKIVEQQKTVETAYAQLATDIGLAANTKFQVQDLPATVTTQPIIESVGELVLQAQNNRQDFLAAQADVRSKEADLRNAKAASRPTISGEFDLGKNYWDGGETEDYNFTASVSLNIPLFKGFFYKNGVRIAKANLEASQASLLDTELTIIQDVTTSQYSVLKAAENVEYSDDYVESAKVNYDVALSNYKAGTGTILNVLSAQSSLADARAQQVSSKRDWFSSLVDLAFATGALCSPTPKTMLEPIELSPCRD